MSGEYCTFPGAIGFDRVFALQDYCEDENSMPSWPVPKAGENSCNVVLLGRPGTGKTTFALELASHLRIIEKNENNDCDTNTKTATVLYFSLEQPRKSLINRLESIGGACAVEGPEFDDNDISKATAKCSDNKESNLVLFPELSPRRLDQNLSGSDANDIFWQRRDEIRLLIERVEAVEKKKTIPALRMVVVDSLNVFGDSPVSRYMIEQLFSVIREHELVGVFVAEDPEAAALSPIKEPLISPGISNLADVVIKLDWDNSVGYAFRTSEVLKSRYTANVYGAQQMKLRKSGVEIFPSLHSQYTFLTNCRGAALSRSDKKNQDRVQFWWREVDSLLRPELATEIDQEVPCLVNLLYGPRGSSKTEVALSYALHAPGVGDRQGEFLAISLDASFQPNERIAGGSRFQLDVKDDAANGMPFPENRGKHDWKSATISYRTVCATTEAHGYKLWMAPGFLTVEEFFYFVHQALVKKKKITRVIFQDIGQIPARHPAIARHIREQGNFFPVLIELFRRMGVDCLFICAEEDIAESEVNDMWRSLIHLSHVVIHASSAEFERVLARWISPKTP